MTKSTRKPNLTSKPEFGSLEHRKAAAAFHHGLVPWLILHTRDDAETAAKRVRIADAKKLKEGKIAHARELCVCKLDDGSEGYGVFFLHTAAAGKDQA